MEGFPTSSLRGGVYRQMPGGLPADNGSVPGRGGRPKAGEGEPPMPKMWKPVERLAGVFHQAAGREVLSSASVVPLSAKYVVSASAEVRISTRVPRLPLKNPSSAALSAADTGAMAIEI